MAELHDLVRIVSSKQRFKMDQTRVGLKVYCTSRICMDLELMEWTADGLPTEGTVDGQLVE